MIRIGLTKPRVRLVRVVAPELLMIDGLDLLTGLSTLAYVHSTTRSTPYIAEKLGQIPSHTIGQPLHRAGPLVWGRTGARAFVAMTPHGCGTSFSSPILLPRSLSAMAASPW